MMTPRQKQVLDYLVQFITVNSIPPTMAEIGKHFGLSSPASVHHILCGLESAGKIRRIPNVSRGIEILPPVIDLSTMDGSASKAALDRAIHDQRVLLEQLIEVRNRCYPQMLRETGVVNKSEIAENFFTKS